MAGGGGGGVAALVLAEGPGPERQCNRPGPPSIMAPFSLLAGRRECGKESRWRSDRTTAVRLPRHPPSLSCRPSPSLSVARRERAKRPFRVPCSVVSRDI
jgi:hypothetical protein